MECKTHHAFTEQLKFADQLARAFCSDNSDTPPGAAEKPHDKAIFRHRIPRFCSSLTTI